MTVLGGRKVEPSPIHVRWEPVKVSLAALLLGWTVKKLAVLFLIIVRSPVAMITIVLVVCGSLIWTQLSPWVDLGAALVIIAALVVLRRRWPAVFDARVRLVLRSRWRRFARYRFWWPASMDTAGLNLYQPDGSQRFPVLGKVISTAQVDRVRVRMLPGQTHADWAKVADRLCQTFGALDCRVRSVPGRVHELELWFLIDDPLADDVQPVAAVSPVDSSALPVGQCEDGAPYLLRLLWTHVLIVGATGAGKGSVLWAVILQLVTGVRDGTVRIWALDPKGGMELAAGASIFDRFIYGDTDTDSTEKGRGFEAEFAIVLEDAVTVMRRRQTAQRGITRRLEPSVADPLIVIIIDELAALTGYVGDRELKRRIGNALSLLLSQGRAVGITILAAVQDPKKETIPARDLFPTRIALRLNEAEQVHLILGPGARDRGARCDQIPEALPGIAYVQVDGVAEPIRVRFAHVTDEHIGEALHTANRLTAITDGHTEPLESGMSDVSDRRAAA